MTQKISFECDAELLVASRRRPRFSMVAYSGGTMTPEGFSGAVVVDIAGVSGADKPRPSFLEHDVERRVGQVEAIGLGESITATGVLLNNEHGRYVVALHKEGFPWRVSIGGKIQQSRRVDAGEVVTANGRQFVGPLTLVQKLSLREISFVGVAADDDAHVTIAAKGKPTMAKKNTTAATLPFDDVRQEDTVPITTQPMESDSPTIRATDSVDLAAMRDDHTKALRETTAAELARQAEIASLFAGSHLDLQAKAIREGWSPVKAELELLRVQRDTAPASISEQSDSKLTAKTTEAALLAAGGVSLEFVAKHYGEDTANEITARHYNGYGLHSLMHDTIRAAGRYARPGQVNNDFLREALRADADLRASSGFTTLSLSNLLENVANKTLLSAYEAIETVWPAISAVRSHSDFKSAATYRLDSSGAFRKVGADGELKHVGLTDAKYTNQLDTYGAIITLTRQMMINDDLGAFMAIPTMLGSQSAIRLEEAVFTLLLANTGSFFHADNNNLLTGASSALDIESLSSAKSKFRTQTSNGKPILTSPSVLLVNTTLEDTANDLFVETETMVTTTADKKRFTRNPHKGMYRPYVSPYLNNTAITNQDGAAISGQSATQWYLFADPGIRAALAVAFLNNRRVPTIESAETDFQTLGMMWRGYHDFGVAFEDPVAAVKSDGA